MPYTVVVLFVLLNVAIGAVCVRRSASASLIDYSPPLQLGRVGRGWHAPGRCVAFCALFGCECFKNRISVLCVSVLLHVELR